MAFTDHFIDVDRCRTHYRRAGKGTPLVFLHGASGAPVVLPFMEKLATRFDVIVPDHPGYGESDEPEWLENIHDVAYFYLDFLAALKLEKAVIIGSSMGGWMAMELAVRDTARIASLVLVSPAGLFAPGAEPADIFLMPQEDMIRRIYHDQKYAEERLAMPVTPEAIDLGLKNRHTTARLGWEPRLQDPFLSKWLHRIDVPVSIVWGAQDEILPVATAHELKRLIPKAELNIFERCGHLPQVEKADEFCDLVVRFACK
ncbi:MAG TPA: alpha/beta hydrolase [Burkholderiales bacterium]|nr:alpha/beta hydrolase [Burkholderiales bacterium]